MWSYKASPSRTGNRSTRSSAVAKNSPGASERDVRDPAVPLDRPAAASVGLEHTEAAGSRSHNRAVGRHRESI
ncbi:MAG: hypothetical protein WBA11_14690 [Rubrivirga sp.]